jgi:hypothetical protein
MLFDPRRRGGRGGGATGSDTLALVEVDTSQLNIADWVSAFKFKEDSWVHLIGSFIQKTDQDIAEPAIITPQSIEPTHQPEKNPYVT